MGPSDCLVVMWPGDHSNESDVIGMGPSDWLVVMWPGDHSNGSDVIFARKWRHWRQSDVISAKMTSQEWSHLIGAKKSQKKSKKIRQIPTKVIFAGKQRHFRGKTALFSSLQHWKAKRWVLFFGHFSANISPILTNKLSYIVLKSCFQKYKLCKGLWPGKYDF